MSRKLLLLLAAGGFFLSAQDPPPVAGRLSYVTGAVSFQPSGAGDWVAATRNRPLTIGDQLFVGDGARADIEVPGTAFHLNSRTAFEFMNLDGRATQIRLSEGTLEFRVRRLQPGENLEIDTTNLAFSVVRPGYYRIDTNPDQSETYVTVRDGEGQLTSTSGAFSVYANQQAVINGSNQYNVYAAPAYDEFDNWAVSRDHRWDRGASGRYVSPAVVGYEDLDDYGDWRSEPQYGEMWIPRGVPSGWAPYHNGHWAWIDPWGWNWVDDEQWGFAPFHYGRWAYVNGNWGWCPGPVNAAPVYAPALVAWLDFGGAVGVSLGFGGGRVGWLPLGPRDVYIPDYQASQTYITRINTTNTTYINNTSITNIYNTYNSTGGVPVTSYANRNVPGAVIAVPQSALTDPRPVQQVATRIQPNQISAIRNAAPPKVVPQLASVLGRPTTAAGSVPRPPAAVLSRPVVAKQAPPPPPPPFQQRQSLLAKNQGRPVPLPQLQQLAKTAPAAAARPPVHVITAARVVAPHVNNAPAPRPMAQQQGTPAPAPAVQPRPYEPPQAQRGQNQAARAPTPAPAPAAPQRPAVQARPYEPPQAQRGQNEAARAPAPAPAPAAQPRPAVQARPYEPPQAQRGQNQAARAPAPAPAPAAPQRPAVQARPYQPPQVQRSQSEGGRAPVAPPAPTQQRSAVPARPSQAPAQPARPAQPVQQSRAPIAAPVPNRPAQAHIAPPQNRPVSPQPVQPSQGQADRMRPAPAPPPPAHAVQPAPRPQPQARPVERPQPRVVEPPRPAAAPQQPQARPVERPQAQPARPAAPQPQPQQRVQPAPAPHPAPATPPQNKERQQH